MDLEQYFKREPIADRGISVVIPTHNEAACLESTVGGVAELLNRMERGHEIIVVDDASTDDTAAVAQRLCESNRRVRTIRHANHSGRGAALRSAFQAAKYPLVLQMDGNNEYEAAEIDRFLAAIDHV